MTTRKFIYGGLILQVILAGLLLGRDLTSALASFAWPSNQPQFDTPVLPGDQRRRYRPSDMPLRPARDGNPSRPFQSTGDMPTRLAFMRDGDTLTLTGQIAPGDGDRLTNELQDDLTHIRLNSPGGSVSDALSIGAQLREANLETLLGAGDICLSACPYILASGVARHVHTDAQVGVHQHSFGSNNALPAFLAIDEIQQGQADVMRHLNDMGVNPLLMQHAMSTPANEIYVLLNDELTEYNLATQIIE